MLQPARRKFRKEHKGRNTGIATRGAAVSFGEFGLKATERGRITARQIEAARRAITPPHQARRPHLHPHLPGQAASRRKPAEVRMGNGKGNPEYYVAEIQPGKVLYEINGVPEPWPVKPSLLAAAKLPLKRTVFVSTPRRRLSGDPQEGITMKAIRTAQARTPPRLDKELG